MIVASVVDLVRDLEGAACRDVMQRTHAHSIKHSTYMYMYMHEQQW